MKKINRPLNWLVCGLLVGTAAYSCKTKEEEVAPKTYTFAEFDNITMPDLVQTAPAAVTISAGAVTSSTMAAAVSSALGSIAPSGPVPDAVQQAGAAVGQAVSEDKAASLTSSFTPDVINSGTLPADMKKEVDALANNASMKDYMPSFSLPTVNGKPVGARVGYTGMALVAVANAVAQSGPVDACQQAATAAYNTAVQKLQSARTNQAASVTTAYTQQETTANNEVASCQAGVPARYDGLRSSLRTQLTNSLTILSSLRSRLGNAMYNRLSLLMYVGYFQALDQVNMIQSADLKVCTATKDAKIASAQAARDADLNRITTTYNTRLNAATTTRDKAVASCHNQGNGG